MQKENWEKRMQSMRVKHKQVKLSLSQSHLERLNWIHRMCNILGINPIKNYELINRNQICIQNKVYSQKKPINWIDLPFSYRQRCQIIPYRMIQLLLLIFLFYRNLLLV